MKNAEELRRDADRYRRLAVGFTDRQTVEALRKLADEYEAIAERLEKGQCTCGPSNGNRKSSG